MSWSMLIPASMGAVGSLCLGLAIALILVDMPGGVAWSKVAGGFALVGGFGTLGGLGGWLGQQILWGSGAALSLSQQWGGRLIGGGILIAFVVGITLWAWKHLHHGNGVGAGGKGQISKRARSFFKATLFALIGAILASVVSPVYDWLNDGLSAAHTFFA